jgi:hypothetical protein
MFVDPFKFIFPAPIATFFPEIGKYDVNALRFLFFFERLIWSSDEHG